MFTWCSLLATTRCYPGIPSSVAAQCPLSAEANKELLCVTCTVKLPHRSKPPPRFYLPAPSRDNDEPTRHSPTLQIGVIPPSHCSCYCVSLQNLLTANRRECLWMHSHFSVCTWSSQFNEAAMMQRKIYNITPPRHPPVCR